MWEGLWKNLPSSKDFLSETIQNPTELTEATKLIKNSASQVANRSFDTLSEATGEVTNKLIETSDEVFAKTDYLANKANQVVNNIELVSDQAISTVTDTAGNSISQVANHSFDALSEATGEVTNKLTTVSDEVFAKTDYLADKANQVVNNIELVSDQAISTVTDIAGNSISQVANQSFDALSEATGEVTNKLTTVSDEALVNIDYLTDKAFSTVTETAGKAQLSLNENFQKTEQLHNSLTHIVQDPINFALKSWISNHPILTWFVGHPLFTALVIIVVILLFLSTINMIIQLPQQLFSALIFSPFKIANYLRGKVLKPINPVTKYSNTTIPHADKHNEDGIITNILSQLETIKQNQEKLSQQMNVIISGSHRKSEEMEILQEDLTQN